MRSLLATIASTALFCSSEAVAWQVSSTVDVDSATVCDVEIFQGRILVRSHASANDTTTVFREFRVEGDHLKHVIDHTSVDVARVVRIAEDGTVFRAPSYGRGRDPFGNVEIQVSFGDPTLPPNQLQLLAPPYSHAYDGGFTFGNGLLAISKFPIGVSSERRLYLFKRRTTGWVLLSAAPYDGDIIRFDVSGHILGRLDGETIRLLSVNDDGLTALSSIDVFSANRDFEIGHRFVAAVGWENAQGLIAVFDPTDGFEVFRGTATELALPRYLGQILRLSDFEFLVASPNAEGPSGVPKAGSFAILQTIDDGFNWHVAFAQNATSDTAARTQIGDCAKVVDANHVVYGEWLNLGKMRLNLLTRQSSDPIPSFSTAAPLDPGFAIPASGAAAPIAIIDPRSPISRVSHDYWKPIYVTWSHNAKNTEYVLDVTLPDTTSIHECRSATIASVGGNFSYRLPGSDFCSLGVCYFLVNSFIHKDCSGQPFKMSVQVTPISLGAVGTPSARVTASY